MQKCHNNVEAHILILFMILLRLYILYWLDTLYKLCRTWEFD